MQLAYTWYYNYYIREETTN